MEKQEIQKIQQACNLILNKKLAEDGIWGPKTQEALKELQKEIGVSADGIYGPKTKNGIAIKLSEYAVKLDNLKGFFAGSSSPDASSVNDFM